MIFQRLIRLIPDIDREVRRRRRGTLVFKYPNKYRKRLAIFHAYLLSYVFFFFFKKIGCDLRGGILEVIYTFITLHLNESKNGVYKVLFGKPNFR